MTDINKIISIKNYKKNKEEKSKKTKLNFDDLLFKRKNLNNQRDFSDINNSSEMNHNSIRQNHIY